MRISTNEFLLGSVNDMLAQQSNVNQLNRQIATGQTMLDATSDPAGAARALGVATAIGHLNYDVANSQAAALNLQNGVSALQQLTTVLSQLQQVAIQASNGTVSNADRQSLVQVAQGAYQQLLQLANTQSPNGNYLFAGSKATTVPFSVPANGQVAFNGDAGTNVVEIAPSITVASTVSANGIFVNLPGGSGGVAIAAAGSNTGTATAVSGGVTSISQLAAERRSGTQFAISFAAGSGGSLTYTVASGTGPPGSGGFAATSGVVASGTYADSSDIVFGGIDLRVSGTPAAGDSFTVQTGASTDIFQTVQNLISALQASGSTPSNNALAQQQLDTALTELQGAQTGALAAQATIGAGLAQIQALQGQNQTVSTNDQVQLSNLQSANLPQVLANYSESVTALQAAQLAFAKVQGLSLFALIRP
jgi:flagellar hook-associated protein 3 FlgL